MYFTDLPLAYGRELFHWLIKDIDVFVVRVIEVLKIIQDSIPKIQCQSLSHNLQSEFFHWSSSLADTMSLFE